MEEKLFVQTTADGIILGTVEASAVGMYPYASELEELPEVLREDHGIPLYRVSGGRAVLRAEAEVHADVAAFEEHQANSEWKSDGQRIAELEVENHRLRIQNGALSEQLDFHEEILVEMAGIVYA